MKGPDMNPLHLLDSLLEEWVSARARRSIHTLLLLAATVFTIYLAADGDWEAAAAALVATFYAGSNRANTDVEAHSDLPTDTIHGGDGVSGNPEGPL